jgi:hypothetical protein
VITASELEALLEENEGLRLELRRLRGKRPADLCWPCEVKRRWLAVVGGNCLAVGWALWFSQSGDAWMKENLSTLSPDAVFWPLLGLLSLGPFVGVFISWKLRLFKRSEAWKHWPLYLAYAAYQEARRRRRHRR